MRIEEAKRIADIVKGLDLANGTKCLNLGSSTRAFREVDQPHIAEFMIRPLEASGIRFVHCDIKAQDGVDMVGDALDPAFQQKLADQNAGVLLCCNMFEHLTDPKPFAAAFDRFLPPGGFAVVTVPYSYPYHPDPIDTMFRPSPSEIAELFPTWRLASGSIVESATYLEDLRRLPNPGAHFAKTMLRVLAPFYRPKHWTTISHRLLWSFRRYKVSIAVLQKPSA